MAYLGRQPVLGNFVKLDAITVVNGQAAYTMQNGGVNFTDYTTVNQFLVSLNGTIQAATDSFTVSGSTITFASNLSTGDVIDFIIVFGNSLSAGTVSDSAITTAKLADSSVSLAKLTATGTKDATTFLRGDNTFASPSSDYVLLSSQTASSDATINFTSNIDSTYKIYIFKFFDIHPSSDAKFAFQTSIDGGSNYNVSTTGSFFRSQLNTSDGSGNTIDIDSSMSSHNNTGNIILTRPITQSASNSASASGELTIYNPAGTTFHKQFLCKSATYGNFTQHGYIGGKINTTSAINAVSFKMDSGNIDAGTISMYGVKT